MLNVQTLSQKVGEKKVSNFNTNLNQKKNAGGKASFVDCLSSSSKSFSRTGSACKDYSTNHDDLRQFKPEIIAKINKTKEPLSDNTVKEPESSSTQSAYSRELGKIKQQDIIDKSSPSGAELMPEDQERTSESENSPTKVVTDPAFQEFMAQLVLDLKTIVGESVPNDNEASGSGAMVVNELEQAEELAGLIQDFLTKYGLVSGAQPDSGEQNTTPADVSNQLVSILNRVLMDNTAQVEGEASKPSNSVQSVSLENQVNTLPIIGNILELYLDQASGDLKPAVITADIDPSSAALMLAGEELSNLSGDQLAAAEPKAYPTDRQGLNPTAATYPEETQAPLNDNTRQHLNRLAALASLAIIDQMMTAQSDAEMSTSSAVDSEGNRLPTNLDLYTKMMAGLQKEFEKLSSKTIPAQTASIQAGTNLTGSMEESKQYQKYYGLLQLMEKFISENPQLPASISRNLAGPDQVKMSPDSSIPIALAATIKEADSENIQAGNSTSGKTDLKADSETPAAQENIETENVVDGKKTGLIAEKLTLEPIRPDNGWKESRIESSPKTMVNPKDIMEQIVRKIEIPAKALNSEMQIQLKPEFLGKMVIKIVIDDGHVTARFITESQHVKQVLEANMSSLKQSLEANGLKVEKTEVNVGLNNGGSFNGNESNRQAMWQQLAQDTKNANHYYHYDDQIVYPDLEGEIAANSQPASTQGFDNKRVDFMV